MVEESIHVDDRYNGQVADIHLGPPPGNIITMVLMEKLSQELARLTAPTPANRHRKLIVFSGVGKHFSYGVSVEEHRADHVGDMLPRFHALIRQILTCDVPTLAKVSGLCLGGGFEIVLACGLLFCSKEAELGVPEIGLGVFPPAASVLLPCKLGDSSVCEIILTGRKYTAEELFQHGAVNGISSSGSLDEAVGEFIEKHILPKSASSLRIACRASRATIRRSFDAHIASAERLYLETLMSTKDAVEGIEAFIEKRTPRWKDQ